MTGAICYKCGAAKAQAFDTCQSCDTAPISEHNRAVSLVLTSIRTNAGQLRIYAEDIRRHGFPIIGEEILRQALDELKSADSAKRALDLLPSTGHPVNKREATKSTLKMGGAEKTSLHLSPFHLLGASTRDPARRIIELAEERSLTLDPQICAKARSDLVTPRSRLSVEVSWMPGVAPQRATALVSSLTADIDAIKQNPGIPPLAHANLLAAALELLDPANAPDVWQSWLLECSSAYEKIIPEDVRRDVNEDRAVAGFPELRQVDAVEAELAECRRRYLEIIKSALNSVPSKALVDVLTTLVNSGTNFGQKQAPQLIDGVVDIYQAEADSHLQSGAEQIQRLVKEMYAAAPRGERAVKPFMDRLEAVLRAWGGLAKPIQVALKARGLDHELSLKLAIDVRSVCIDLFNKHHMHELVRDFTARLGELFVELPEFTQRLEDDSKAINNVIKEKKEEETWRREITYEAEVGMFLKDILRISPNGAQWKDSIYPLDSITRVRWGGINHSINGIPSGSTYHIAFGDDDRESHIELKKSATFENFVNRLWQAVGARMMVQMLQRLKRGDSCWFGDCVITDKGVQLIKHNFLIANEKVFVEWRDVRIWSHDGQFVMGKDGDKKTYGSMSYINTPNAHVCEAVVRAAFKKGAIPLSNLLTLN